MHDHRIIFTFIFDEALERPAAGHKPPFFKSPPARIEDARHAPSPLITLCVIFDKGVRAWLTGVPFASVSKSIRSSRSSI